MGSDDGCDMGSIVGSGISCAIDFNGEGSLIDGATVRVRFLSCVGATVLHCVSGNFVSIIFGTFCLLLAGQVVAD